MKYAPMLDPHLADVWGCLDRVMDPELDEPITDMGFVEAVSRTGPAEVTVVFRLPTYWCSPNFAFLMAEDIRRQVEMLDWVERAVVRLEDHMAAEEMNAAVNAGGSFADVFSELRSGEDLCALREKFDHKAFQRRQEVVIKGLIAAGQPIASVLSMTLGALQDVAFDDAEAARQKNRYLDLLRTKELAAAPGDLAILRYEGTAISEEDFRLYMELLRSVRINMEFSGSLCRGLKRSRYKQADLSGDTPTLVDFIGQEARGAGLRQADT